MQNEQSEFGRLAKRIVGRRLERIGCKKTPDEFFPVHESVKQGLADAKEAARAEALKKYPGGTPTQISDYVYKYHRAVYFRRRERANLPVYSGFETIVYLSTGVVRNLLEPCYWMYESALSSSAEADPRKQSFSRASARPSRTTSSSGRAGRHGMCSEMGLDDVVVGLQRRRRATDPSAVRAACAVVSRPTAWFRVRTSARPHFRFPDRSEGRTSRSWSGC